MHRMIDFPHIGIHLKSVGDHITIFGFDIAYYGIVIGIGILAGIFIAAMEAKRTGQNPEDYYDLAIYAVIFSIIGARIYYVIFSWDMYKRDILSVFNIRQGGLAIYGGVIAAVITVTVFARRRNLSAPLLMDTAGLGLVAGQMIGRWGNFFNREAFGEYTDWLLAMRLPVDAVRGSDITDLMRKHMETVDDVSFIQVHPTFLYESLWCLLILILLLIYRKHKQFDGEIFLLYLAGYGFGRFWIERLRTDQLLLPNGFPVSQLLAGILVVGSVLFLLYNWRRLRYFD
ncbi:MAG: prolipoprotein diacylglyceryl transferase [Dorea sp.]|uniref:prolipoprotein diacylglyceryl transferase n=1 Tax=Sporofaciens sp. JLR.KK001 TaxID=3112621 RepID=UPI00216BC4A4|nr:prolipoprotein diacylglyceryl transferase [Dorea sp.]